MNYNANNGNDLTIIYKVYRCPECNMKSQ